MPKKCERQIVQANMGEKDYNVKICAHLILQLTRIN